MYVCLSVCLFRDSPQCARASSFLRFLDHTQRRTTVGRISFGRVISSLQKPLPDNKQHSQQTNIMPTGGIRTHDLSRRAGADLRVRPRGHSDRHRMYVLFGNFTFGRVQLKDSANIRMHGMENFKIYFCRLCGIQA